MRDLTEVLAQIRERIARHQDARVMNEQNTKAALVEPVLRALGWSVEDVDEVVHEYKRKKADKPVDYALLILRTPRLFVEVKALGQNLDDRKWANQIMGYASVAGVEWVVLTDGDKYRIYNSHAAVPVEKKIFRSIRITDESSPSEETLALLSKEQMRENRIEILWNVQFVDRQIRTTIEQLFSPEPDKSLIRLVKKRTPNLSAKDIKASLGRARVILDFPVEPDIYYKPRHRKVISIKKPGKVTPEAGITLLNLIKAGFIKPPLELKKRYKGHDLTARIEVDGRVSCLGKAYTSLSTSAAMARKSIIGAPPGRKYPQTNGWHFWHFRDQDGELKCIDILRQRFLVKK